MKNFIYITVLALGLVSCGNSNKKQSTETNPQVEAVAVDKAVSVEDMLAKAETLVGKEVVLKGKISHTCKHSGRRCFVVGKDGKTSIRVEAKGNIGGFNRELIGSEIAIKGILRENRLSEDDINQMKKALEEEKAAKGASESCDTEIKNIESMREWMKNNNKESYSLYYMDGMEYEVLE